MTPEEALAAARAAAAERRRAGEEDGTELPVLATGSSDGVTLERLLEWATVEPDLGLVRSTRPWGAPITWVKRGLVHLLRQHTDQVLAQQGRFNLQLVVFVSQLADRVSRLEEEAALQAAPPPPDA